MNKDLADKIGKIASKQDRVNEDEIRSLMILVRKVLEKMTQTERSHFLVLNLFCNWAAHNEISNSNTGLRILAKVNDALVGIRHLSDVMEMGLRMSEAISFTVLRRELKSFFGYMGVGDALVDNNKTWGMVFLSHLIEIIRDVPLSFPPLKTLDGTRLKIYYQIARNPIKPGAGVIAIWLSKVDYGRFMGKDIEEHLCIHIRTEDTTTIVIPLTVDVRLK